jgi:hypothetical protein
MQAVQRLMNAKEGWFHIVKTLYLVLALPFFLITGLLSLVALSGSSPGQQTRDSWTLVAMFWTPVVIPLILFIVTSRARGRLLKSVLLSLKSRDIFWPAEECEFFLWNSGRYLGIDNKNGTILYINRIRRGQVDVVGLSMGDWTGRELDGKTLRLYTKFPDLPRIEFHTPWAERWYDMLGAMEYKRYNTAKPFGQYVSEHVEALERENNIHIPKLA